MADGTADTTLPDTSDPKPDGQSFGTSGIAPMDRPSAVTRFFMGIVAWAERLNFKYAILAIFVVAAVITPSQDMASQLIVAVPMTVLYILSILVAAVFGKKKRDTT